MHLFPGCSLGSPALRAADDPASVPCGAAAALLCENRTCEILTGDRVTRGKLLRLIANCVRSQGRHRGATRMHCSGFTCHIMATEEYTHTIVTQTRMVSLRQTWGRMNNIPPHLSYSWFISTLSTPLLSLSLLFTQYCFVAHCAISLCLGNISSC